MRREGTAPALEVCPTSNLITLRLKSYADHPHIRRLMAMDYPLSINTDDAGIFNTSLSKELLHMVTSLKLKVVDAVQLSCEIHTTTDRDPDLNPTNSAVSAIDQSFASEEERLLLKERFWSGIDATLKAFSIKDIESLRAGPVEMDLSSLYTL